MLDLFQWFYLQKIEGRNPFWRLLELIAESNDYENVNNAQVDEVPDVEGAAVGGDDVEKVNTIMVLIHQPVKKSTLGKIAKNCP